MICQANYAARRVAESCYQTQAVIAECVISEKNLTKASVKTIREAASRAKRAKQSPGQRALVTATGVSAGGAMSRMHEVSLAIVTAQKGHSSLSKAILLALASVIES